jgi:ABC transporter, phosphonate, periplasmic substrate-binding protein
MGSRLLLLAMLSVTPSTASAADKAGPVALVIVHPGGPDVGAEGNKLAAELAAHLAGSAGIDAAQLEAAYFNQTAPALVYLKKHKDAFVLGGLGVFLSQRKALKLVPLARLAGKSGSDEEFSVVVRKGRYANLDELKGKTLVGSVLADDARYVDRFAFGGKLESSAWFRCTPSERPLSALRKLASDDVDAVLVNRAQMEALRAMPLHEKVQAIFNSGPVPTVGLMMAATSRTQALRARVVQAVSKLCGTEKGAPVCQTYGITGFEPIGEDALAQAIKKYEAR